MEIVVQFIGGIAQFLLGMNIMAVGLQKFAGSRMKKLLGVLTKNKWLSVLVGAAVTAIIQSSSATTVMVVGFVNAGIMNLVQACGVIMGANIGTTMTGWIVSSSEWASFLNPSKGAPLVMALGVVLLLFGKNEKTKKIGEIIAGFGLLFLGIENMSKGVAPLQYNEQFKSLLISFGNNPFLGILAGALITAVIQSSSASVGILQSLAMAGLVPLDSAIFIIMGQNIGTCATAILSSIGASKNAKCAAYIHLIFNITGTMVFTLAALIFFHFADPAIGDQFISSTQISLVHTLFNIFCTVILFPFPNYLINSAKKIAGIKEEEKDLADAIHLDDRIISSSPVFAIENAKKESLRMGNLVLEMLLACEKTILDKDKSKVDFIVENESLIDNLHAAVTEHLIKISRTEISAEEHDNIASLIQIISDFERVGDHCENISELSLYIFEEKIEFSSKAKDELTEVFSHSANAFRNALKAFEYEDMAFAKEAVKEEVLVDELEIRLRASHIKRLTASLCKPESGVMFLDILTNLERITDHSRNIAEEVLQK